MNPADKQTIIDRYEHRFAEFGEDIRSLASGTKERQRTRFQVLLELGIESGSSVLDLGCGFADFYGFLQENDLDVEYTGYDLSPAFIDVARRKYPAADFAVRDIQEEQHSRRFDYVISSQVFNTRLNHQDNFDVAKDILARCYGMADKGLAFDFLSSYVDFRDEELYYYSPEHIFSFCKSLSKRVCIRHDYPLFEFAVYVYPDFQGWDPGAAPAAAGK